MHLKLKTLKIKHQIMIGTRLKHRSPTLEISFNFTKTNNIVILAFPQQHRQKVTIFGYSGGRLMLLNAKKCKEHNISYQLKCIIFLKCYVLYMQTRQFTIMHCICKHDNLPKGNANFSI